MKKSFIFFIAILFLNFSSAISEKHIVFLDLDFIVQNSNVGKSMIQKFDKKMKNNQKIIDEKFKKLIENEKSLVKKKNIISKEEFEKELKVLRNERSKFENLRKKTISDFNNNKQKSLQDLISKINQILINYSEQNKTSLIMNKKNLIIGKNELDITTQILDIVNKEIKN